MDISNSSVMQQANLERTMAQGMGNTPPPPPPPKPEEDELSDFMAESGDSDAVKSFMQSIMDMEDSGEFDAETLATTAPETLQSYAEEHNIDLATFFQAKHDSMQEAKTASSAEPAATVPSAVDQYASTEDIGKPEKGLFDMLKSSLGIKTQA